MLASRLRRQKSDARTGVDSEIIILFIPMTQQYFELIAKKTRHSKWNAAFSLLFRYYT